ncbi:membrane-bound lytic murein transglycosylase A [Desulfuromonas thiophila]|uniref:peptidoglycan lytic exotransglycosylase n=1 Tax=Desulfuromonas thiophila TaxID=57664 RepID=A0A1G7A3S3_9BACT|nr:membrane-bound lytic murein transglycosylase A [Desulfuromonas thiophila]
MSWRLQTRPCRCRFRPSAWAQALLLTLILALSACAPKPAPVPEALPPVSAARPAPPAAAEPYRPVRFADLPGWQQDDQLGALRAFRRSCRSLRWRDGWADLCRRAAVLPEQPEAIRAFFEQEFTPWQLQQEDGQPEGELTGYYIPDVEGRRQPDEEFRYPLYARPDDLLIIDLTAVYPELKGYRLRGRLEGNRVLPYFARAEIETDQPPLRGSELFWLKDPVALFFLQIQGSGRILLPGGERVLIQNADQNGHPFRSIGKLLLDSGEMRRHQMSQQNLSRWARENPGRVRQLLNENPSYVFFRVVENSSDGPTGAQGVPLTARRSLAVDPRFVPLGAPVYLTSRWPKSGEPLQRLMIAQDAGGAIKGRVRADFFWGMGDQAGFYAARTKFPARLWLLWPQGRAPGR